MTGPMEFSLKYCFDIADIKHLQPGDKVPSSCPPTDTMHNGRSVVKSPGGVPLHFSLHLSYAKLLPGFYKHHQTKHRFLLQLALEQPSDVPCLPPFHIQPVSIPRHHVHCPMDVRLLGPLQAAVWEFTWPKPESWPPEPLADRFTASIPAQLGWEPPGPDSPWTGEFRFQLLDEPLRLIASHPPPSKAEWSCLPEDMISAVLRELPLADRVSARLVCRTWWRILDSDSRVWSNVTHLQSIGIKTLREESSTYDHHKGRFNQVRNLNICKALGFLTSRKANICSFELDQDPPHMYRGFENLPIPSELSQHKIKLKALIFHASLCCGLDGERVVAGAALLKLIEGQPSLERVHLEHVSVPISSLLQALPRLRILSLDNPSCMYRQYWDSFLTQPPQLSGLHGLRVGSKLYFSDATFANLSSIVESGSRLRRVEGMSWPPGKYMNPSGICFPFGNDVVWGTESLSPTSAAFLLMPTHDNLYSTVNHHCI